MGKENIGQGYRAKAQKGSSQDGDVRKEVNIGGILTHEYMKNLEFRMVPEKGSLNGYGVVLSELRKECTEDIRSAQPKVIVAGKELVRPLTARESLLARIIDYEEKTEAGNRLRFFFRPSGTSAGIAYPYDDNTSLPVTEPRRAKIQQICTPLLDLRRGDLVQYLEVAYDNIDAPEVDLTKGKWNEKLSKSEVLEHEGWRNLVGDDEEGRRILSNYTDIIFSEVQRHFRMDKAMAFYKLDSIVVPQLMALWLTNFINDSDAVGNRGLDRSITFIQVFQRA